MKIGGSVLVMLTSPFLLMASSSSLAPGSLSLKMFLFSVGELFQSVFWTFWCLHLLIWLPKLMRRKILQCGSKDSSKPFGEETQQVATSNGHTVDKFLGRKVTLTFLSSTNRDWSDCAQRWRTAMRSSQSMSNANLKSASRWRVLMGRKVVFQSTTTLSISSSSILMPTATLPLLLLLSRQALLSSRCQPSWKWDWWQLNHGGTTSLWTWISPIFRKGLTGQKTMTNSWSRSEFVVAKLPKSNLLWITTDATCTDCWWSITVCWRSDYEVKININR